MGYSQWDDDPYYISPEEERAMEEAEEEERSREEIEAREEAEIETWLASRLWWWNTWKRWQWRLYCGPRYWLLRNTALGRRYVDFKIDRDRAASFCSVSFVCAAVAVSFCSKIPLAVINPVTKAAPPVKCGVNVPRCGSR
jgi:hypothetical protein